MAAARSNSGHSHTLGHCQPSVFTSVQDCRLQAVKTAKTLRGVVCYPGRLWPQPYRGPLPAMCFYRRPRLPFASHQNRQPLRGVVCYPGRFWPQPYLGPLPDICFPRRRLLPRATLATAIPWATARHLFLPVSSLPAVKTPKPSAASFATPGDFGHSHTLGPLPAIGFYRCPRLPFASRQNPQNSPQQRRLLPRATLATAIPWATASHVSLPVSKTAACQPSKP